MQRRLRAPAIAVSSVALGLLLVACSAKKPGDPPQAEGSTPPYGAREGHPPPATPDAGTIGDGGTGELGTLTCAWLRGATNCWATTVAEIRTCAPTGSASFDPALDVCQYASGEGAKFNVAPQFPWKAGAAVDYGVANGDGTVCYAIKTTVPRSGAPDGTIVIASARHGAFLQRSGGVTTIGCNGDVAVSTADEAGVAKECGGFPDVLFGESATATVDVVAGPPSAAASSKVRVLTCQ